MDRARKSNKPEMSSDGATALAVQTAPEPVVRPQGEIKLEEVRAAVVAAMEDNGHRTFAGMLGAGSWALEQNEVAVKVNATAAVVEMSFGKEVARLANQAAAAASGRPLKIRLIAAPAASGNGGAAPRPVPPSTGTTRARALEEPLVKKAQELFNAEIRSIIDQKK